MDSLKEITYKDLQLLIPSLMFALLGHLTLLAISGMNCSFFSGEQCGDFLTEDPSDPDTQLQLLRCSASQVALREQMLHMNAWMETLFSLQEIPSGSVMETLLLVKYWWIIFHITNSYLRREPPAIILPWAAWQPVQCGCSICLGEKQENLYICRDSVLEVRCPCECCLWIMNIRYDEEVQGIEEGYPQDMRNWRGVPSHIDGAITWNDGNNITQKCLTYIWFSFRCHIFLQE